MIDVMKVISKRETHEVLRLSEYIREYAESRKEEQDATTAMLDYKQDLNIEQDPSKIREMERAINGAMNNINVCYQHLELYLRFLSFHPLVCRKQVDWFNIRRHYKNVKAYQKYKTSKVHKVGSIEVETIAEDTTLKTNYDIACRFFRHQDVNAPDFIEGLGKTLSKELHNPSFLKNLTGAELDQLMIDYNVFNGLN